MNETTLRVQGMTCGRCVRHVEDALTAIAGVHEVDVDLAKHQATIWHDTGLASDTFERAVTEAGYPATPLT